MFKDMYVSAAKFLKANPVAEKALLVAGGVGLKTGWDKRKKIAKAVTDFFGEEKKSSGKKSGKSRSRKSRAAKPKTSTKKKTSSRKAA